MAKTTEAQIRAKLRELNPDLFGANKQPLVAQKIRFILTGKYNKDAAGNKVTQFTQISNPSEDAKKANPNLRASRYFRVTSTDYTKTITSPDDVISFGRKPWASNIFESQHPEAYSEIMRLLMEKKDGEFVYFEKLPDDRDGNPVIRLRNPIWGNFLTVQVPGHYVVDARTGKPLEASPKNIATGKFEKPRPITMREMRIMLYDYQFNSAEALAMAQYQKLVEPMIAEEITYTVNTAGVITDEKPIPSVAAEGIEPENVDVDTPAADDAGVPLP